MKSLKKFATLVLAAHLANFAVLSTGHAAMVSTQQVQTAESSHATISSFMSREDVQAELTRMGVSADDAAARIAALTDDEAAQLAQSIERAPAGSGFIEAAVFVFLVLLITDILGYTKIFPFTRPIK